MNENKAEFENLELSGEQLERVDRIYDKVMELCKVMCDDPELEWDMRFIGDIADRAADSLVRYDKRVRFPAIVTREDGSQYISEYLGD